MSGNEEKAQRYIGLLDTARVNGNWAELPELTRKVTKHAPHRKTLIATAILEIETIKYRAAGNRPRSSAKEASSPLAAPLDHLNREITSSVGSKTPQDGIQGRTCIWWAHWVSGSDEEVFTPGSVTPYAEEEDATYSLWTKICVVKAACIKGMISNERGATLEADVAFERVIPMLHMNGSAIASTPQLKYWAEQILAEIAIIRSSQDHSDGGDTAIPAFRQWAQLATKGTQPVGSAYGHARTPRSRLSVWRAYYLRLSDILSKSQPSSPSQQRSALVPELRRVETAYENELLRNVQFPKASQSNQVIEEWVEQVIRNWKILCGSQWRDSDLGDGGRNSLGRDVVEILYRAAMKTFHSTLILRRLFQVHKSLTDFDLAYKALDTYLELIDRGRTRAAKAAQPPVGQDDDELVLLTLAEGVEGLCSFGHQQEADKAHELCNKLEHLVKTIDPSASLPANEDVLVNGDPQHIPTTVERLSTTSRNLVHRALGIANANWARWTPFSEHRSALQAKALAHLRFAINQPLPDTEKLSSIYAQALLLAETRDIDSAVETIKGGLMHESSNPIEGQILGRQRIAAWHLLSLLLTSREDFDTAEQTCIAGYSQLSPLDSFSGAVSGRSVSTTAKREAEVGFMHDMECDELQSVIEIRLTELALCELTQGPEDAVNRSSDLLALYSKLFGNLGMAAEDKLPIKTLQPPKSSAGSTVRSTRGSIFHRKRLTTNTTALNEKANLAPSRPHTRTSQAPTIKVTDEDEKPTPEKQHHFFRHSRESSRQEKRLSLRGLSRERKQLPANSTISSPRQSFDTSQEHPPSSIGSVETAQPHLSPILSAEETQRPSTPPATNIQNTDNEATPTAKQPLPNISHNLGKHDDLPASAGHEAQPPTQDTRLPSSPSLHTPIPRFPRAAAQRHALTLLVKLWLCIAKLYRRATMFEDSREATDEAAKAALKVESLVASVESSARAFADPGWGGDGKSSDEIWADVYAERGACALAMALLRAEVDQREQQKNSPQLRRPQDEQQVPSHIDSEGVRDAVEMFEQCLMYFPNHSGGIVGLSNILLDYYERKVELGRKVDDGKAKAEIKRAQSSLGRGVRVGGAGQRNAEPNISTSSDHPVNAGPENTQRSWHPSVTPDDDLKKTPENLNRLAARDRAYGLLSTLTKLGSGWDDTGAWLALSRAHELGGDLEKAKEILWYVVELCDTAPIRHWSNISCRGYVL